MRATLRGATMLVRGSETMDTLAFLLGLSPEETDRLFVEAAEVTLSVLVMQSWVGHTTLLEVQEYTRRADRRRVISGGHPVKRDPAGA